MMRAASNLRPGSTGRWPVAFGSLPNACWQTECANKPSSRRAAANYRLAACAPQKQRRPRWFILTFALWLGANLSILAQHDVVDLALPTDNDALFRGDGPAFYQYIERDYLGEKSKPWEGGQYGYVRDPKETGAGIIYTRFHEGIDIRALQRDERGEPLDEVRAIADGKVVHTNAGAGSSNYGRYVVIEHQWDGSSYYSLYGHLSSIGVQKGQRVKKGERVAVMGHTGAGLNQERAHLHLELNLMMSRRFEEWHDHFFKKDPNHNGIYNGINLTGMNVAKLFIRLREKPSLTIAEFLADEEMFYKVTLPNSPNFELLKRYPWMLKGRAAGKTPASWEVSFTRTGLPLKIEPSTREVAKPELTFAKQSAVDCSYLTHDFVAGRGERAHLTTSGRSFMRLLIWPD